VSESPARRRAGGPQRLVNDPGLQRFGTATLKKGRDGVARWLITFGVLIVLGSLCWPWLHAYGLPELPGDLLVDFVPGVRFQLPITTALLISGVIALASKLLSR